MDRRSETLFLSMDEVEVASYEPVQPTAPSKALIMEDVEVASMEEVVLSPVSNQFMMDEGEVASTTETPRPRQSALNMSEVEVASATDNPHPRQSALNMSEVEVASSGVHTHPQGLLARSTRGRVWDAEVAAKGNSPQHPPAFEENDSSPPEVKEAEEKAEIGKHFGRNFARSLSRKLNILSAKMDREFSVLHERLDALSGSQLASEELMRPLNLNSDAEYCAFRKQAKFPAFRRKLISALVFNGGMSPEEMGIRCVDFLIDSDFQKEFAWFGRSPKIPFTECFANIVKDAVWKRFPNANFASVEQRVQRHLALATETEVRYSRKRKLSADPRDV